MSGYVNRKNQRADYTMIHGVKTDENGVVLYGAGLHSLHTPFKDFEYVTSCCPECSTDDHQIAAWVDHVGDDICPKCGMVCNGDKVPVEHEDFTFRQTRGSGEPSGVPALSPAPYPTDKNSSDAQA